MPTSEGARTITPPTSPPTTERLGVVRPWLDELARDVGADRWSLAVREGGAWRVVSPSETLRDEVLLHLANDPDRGVTGAAAVLELDELGDAGDRLRAAGVDRLLVLPGGPDGCVFLESPSAERARRFVQQEAEAVARLDVAGLLRVEGLAADLVALAGWWPEDGEDAPTRTPEGAVLAERLSAAATTVEESADESRRNALLRERARIASVIHEGITQVLTNVAIQLEVLGHVADDAETARKMVSSARGAVLEALDSLRTVIFDLTPPAEEWRDLAGGLTRFVADFAAQWGFRAELEIDGGTRETDAEVTSLVFAFVQEALTNVRKHADVDAAQVRLAFRPGTVEVEVSDHGVGVARSAGTSGEDALRRHQGLQIMGSRVRLLGGTLEVDSDDGGTSVRMEVPA